MSEELARSAGRNGKVVEGTRERSGTGEWGSIGMQEHDTSKLQVMLKTMGSDTAPSVPSPYRALYLLPLMI